MYKNDAIALALNCIDWRYKETNPQTCNTKNNCERPKEWDQFASQWIKSSGARKFKPIYQSVAVARTTINDRIHSIAILTAAVLAQGAKNKAKTSRAAKSE